MSGLVAGVPPRRVVLAGLGAAARGQDADLAELRAALRQACRSGLRPLRWAARDLDLELSGAAYGPSGVTAVTLEHRAVPSGSPGGDRRLLVATDQHAASLDEGVLARRTNAYATARMQGSPADAAEAGVRRCWTLTEDTVEIDGVTVRGHRHGLAGEWLWTGAHSGRLVMVHGQGVETGRLRLCSLRTQDLDG